MKKLENILIPIFRNSYFGLGFLLIGLLVQILSFIYSDPKSTLSLISGIMGVTAVVLTSRRSMWFYLVGFIQLATYIWICFYERLWGEIGENIFYLITMIVGYFLWRNTYDGKRVKVRSMLRGNTIALLITTLLLSYGFYRILLVTNDSQPFMDSISTVPAIVAQFLLIFRYREQWIFWFIINVASVIMWSIAENYNMVAQYIFWTLNCFYGWIMWSDQDY